MQRRLIITEDGSHTLRVDGLNEHYHSTYGAISESLHVFIEAGLRRKLEEQLPKLHILEIGFGTGLNALLTLLDEGIRGCEIEYTGLEACPLEADLWQGLNYPDLIKDKRAGELFAKLHAAEWETQLEIVPGFTLKKTEQKLEDYQHTGNMVDLIYFDAFGPDVQPDLWTEGIFEKIAGLTSSGGNLVTYSCKGSVKRALKAAGFEIEKIPGPKGKREMLRGVRQ